MRVPEVNRSLIARVLDAGALGIMIPRIRTADEVKAAVAPTRFPPLGVRGFSLGMANTRFKYVDVSDVVMRQVDDEILVIIQIEEQEALANLDAIASVDGVDGLFVGPADLSISLGVAGQSDHPLMREGITRVIQACRRARIAPGITSDTATFERDLGMGMRFLTFGTDLFFIQEACQRAMQDFRKLVKPKNPGSA